MSNLYIDNIEEFVIAQILNPYFNTVWNKWRQDPNYYPFILVEEYPGQNLERKNSERWLKHLQHLIRKDPTQIVSWLELFPEWKEQVRERLKLFGPVTIYRWLQCPDITNYITVELGIEVIRVA